MVHQGGEVEAPIHFMDRSEMWESVKPYNFQYYPKEDFPRHNIKHSPCTIRVRNMRLCEPPPSLDVEGFEVHNMQSKMECSDFIDDDKVRDIYCRELEQHFLEALGAKHVRALDYQVRQRSDGFPYFGGKLPSRPQPSLMAHVDVTPEMTKTIISDLLGDLATQVMESRYQIITVWRPCRVPIQDWPLAICDATTVDQADLVPTDIIYPTFVTENFMVHYNKKNQWYWLPEQEADEMLVFKAVDSHDPKSCPCPHGAFPLPEQNLRDDINPPRQSIDIRLLVLYADIEYPR